MDSFVFAPVMAGFWTHRDVVEDVYTLDDLLDAHEMLQVKYENELRAQEAAEQRRGQP
ncbi:DUF6889 family protein [Paenibacillus agricola]|uniref:4-alpha-glucanotransferase n=1 Tax=Paenibacillus agricola TaxID=2716264 RepID=A0ABX0JAR1_9BACL|nr:4-alpha-glucanotransferase [Paenibacillus agricola]NHN33545.1 4-alpha-glucanotransferase [Paenibacillus agricola]